MINLIINEIFNTYSLNTVVSIGTANHNANISRRILLIPNYKFVEKIDFGTPGNKFAVAIGYNPSSVSTNLTMDKTNIKLSNYLISLGYDGYYLLNLYPEINSKKIIKTTSNYNVDFYNIIERVLIRFYNINQQILDLYIFWGRSVYLNLNKINSLTNGFTNYSNFATTNTISNLHEHPSYVPQSHIGNKSINLPLTTKIK